MAVSLNSVISFSHTLQARYHHVSRSCLGNSVLKAITFTSPSGKYGSRGHITDKRWCFLFSVANSDHALTDPNAKSSGNSENSLFDDQYSAVPLISAVGNSKLQSSVEDESESQTSEASKESLVSPQQDTSSPPDVKAKLKRSPLTAREKLRAARVLSRYMESKASKSELGNNVLEALKEIDKGKKQSGLSAPPANLFDDSKRGLPKQGLTFELPGGVDALLIAFSFVFISTVMFATTYIVWKVGAIHFNEY